MPDDTAPKTDAEKVVEQAQEALIDRAPTVFVKGGTSTAKNDQALAEAWADSERRRDESLLEERLSRIPIEQGGAKLFTNKLTPNADVPQLYLLLHYVNRQGQKVPPGECLADLKIDISGDRMKDFVMIICPRCYGDGRHADSCQIMLVQENKRWQLAPGKGPPVFVFDDGFGPQTYRSAGTLVESEPFTCGYCHYRGVLTNNQIREI